MRTHCELLQEQTEITFWFFADWVQATVEAFNQSQQPVRV